MTEVDEKKSIFKKIWDHPLTPFWWIPGVIILKLIQYYTTGSY